MSIVASTIALESAFDSTDTNRNGKATWPWQEEIKKKINFRQILFVGWFELIVCRIFIINLIEDDIIIFFKSPQLQFLLNTQSKCRDFNDHVTQLISNTWVHILQGLEAPNAHKLGPYLKVESTLGIYNINCLSKTSSLTQISNTR